MRFQVQIKNPITGAWSVDRTFAWGGLARDYAKKEYASDRHKDRVRVIPEPENDDAQAMGFGCNHSHDWIAPGKLERR